MNHGFFGQEWATTCKTSEEEEEEEENIERGEGPDADIHGAEMARLICGQWRNRDGVELRNDHRQQLGPAVIRSYILKNATST